MIYVIVAMINKLETFGFKTADCERALLISKGDLKRAASWLTDNLHPISMNRNLTETKNQDGINIAAVDVSLIK